MFGGGCFVLGFFLKELGVVFVIQDEIELVLQSQSNLVNKGVTFPCLGLVRSTPRCYGEKHMARGEDRDRDGDTQTTPCI